MVESRGYDSRSQAIGEMVTYQLAEHKRKLGNDVMVGTITLLYDRLTRGLQKKLADLQAEHIDEVQTTLDRTMLLENPSTYVQFESSDLSEIEFLSELVKRTGCGLLLDVNNVFVSATNHAYDARAYLDAFPVEHVGEIHLGGHAADRDDGDAELLIDAHGSAVTGAVWDLYARTIARAGEKARGATLYLKQTYFRRSYRHRVQVRRTDGEKG